MEIARILFNSGRFCRYVTMLLSMEKSHRIGLCELSKAGLRLSCFLLFFSSWCWGNKGKKREMVYFTQADTWKSYSFHLKQLLPGAALGRAMKLQLCAQPGSRSSKLPAACCMPAAWRHGQAWTHIQGLPKLLLSEYLPSLPNHLLFYALLKRNNGPYSLGRQDTPRGTGIIYTYLARPECSCM